MSVPRRPSFRPQAVAAALLLAAACSRTPPPPPQITLAGAGPTHPGHVSVTGLGTPAIRALARLDAGSPDWPRVLDVRVMDDAGTAADTAVAGRYTVDGDTVRFTPLFPFDGGRRYQVTYHGPAGTPASAAAPIQATVMPPAPAPGPEVAVTEVFPSGDLLENQLRLYIHFSGPMGRRPGLEHVKLFDDTGKEVADPFLPVDGELWNADRTRYTVFFDPGRQKRGIRPNRELGASLHAGRTYTLRISREWRDGEGKPLRESVERRFTVRRAGRSPLDLAAWQISTPRQDTTDPLVIRFPEPLDHGLLLRALGVRKDGQPWVGEVRVDAHETRWTMTPSQPWAAGRYEVIALGILEDLAGNRIGRAFEIVGQDDAAEDEAKVTAVPIRVIPAS